MSSLDYYCSLLKDPISKKDEKTSTYEELIENNLRFVVLMAHKMTDRMSLEDLVQWGNIGLMTAAEKFDSSKNCKFISYAKHYIKEYMRRGICKNCKVAKDSEHTSSFVYLDAVIADNNCVLNDVCHNETLQFNPAYITIKHEEHCLLNKYTNTLSGIQLEIVRHIYGMDGYKHMSIKELSNKFNCSGMTIRHHQKQALKKLKKLMDGRK